MELYMNGLYNSDDVASRYDREDNQTECRSMLTLMVFKGGDPWWLCW